jgi:hypothetical protein
MFWDEHTAKLLATPTPNHLRTVRGLGCLRMSSIHLSSDLVSGLTSYKALTIESCSIFNNTQDTKVLIPRH